GRGGGGGGAVAGGHRVGRGLRGRLLRLPGREEAGGMGAAPGLGVLAPMDLLLSHGYFLGEDKAEQKIMRPYPPLGLLYVASHLKARGFAVSVFDSTFRTYAEFAGLVARERPP